jgi:hypothetical protein
MQQQAKDVPCRKLYLGLDNLLKRRQQSMEKFAKALRPSESDTEFRKGGFGDGFQGGPIVSKAISPD